eukprot:gene2811-1796_t
MHKRPTTGNHFATPQANLTKAQHQHLKVNMQRPHRLTTDSNTTLQHRQHLVNIRQTSTQPAANINTQQHTNPANQSTSIFKSQPYQQTSPTKAHPLGATPQNPHLGLRTAPTPNPAHYANQLITSQIPNTHSTQPTKPSILGNTQSASPRLAEMYPETNLKHYHQRPTNPTLGGAPTPT